VPSWLRTVISSTGAKRTWASHGSFCVELAQLRSLDREHFLRLRTGGGEDGDPAAGDREVGDGPAPSTSRSTAPPETGTRARWYTVVLQQEGTEPPSGDQVGGGRSVERPGEHRAGPPATGTTATFWPA
jgi:hypothetical protein